MCWISSKLVTNKSVDLDRIPNTYLRVVADIFAEHLCLLFNSSIASGYIPSDLKIAKAFPLHKGNSKTNPNNLRPISILSSISKIMERLVYNQLCLSLSDNKLLNKLIAIRISILTFNRHNFAWRSAGNQW